MLRLLAFGMVFGFILITMLFMAGANWRQMANGIRAGGSDGLISFHPVGGNSSSRWVHAEPWLDFNMFQSGHRSYAQEGPHARADVTSGAAT